MAVHGDLADPGAVERGEDTPRLHTFASWMVLLAMVPLALGITSEFYVVLEKVLQSTPLALGIAAGALVLLFGLWFGLTLAVRLAGASTAAATALHNPTSGAGAELLSRR